MMNLRSGVTAVVVLVFATNAMAQEPGTRKWEDWDVTIGAGAIYGPVSPGIDKYEVTPIPYVDIEYLDRFFIKTQRGIGAYALRAENKDDYGLGFALGYDPGRKEEDARDELNGLGDVDGSLEAILFAEGEIGPVDLELELAKGLGEDGHDGFRARLSAGVDTMLGDSVLIGAGPFITYGDDQYVESYYGVSAEQAARSTKFGRFDAEGGIESFGVEASAVYLIDRNWSISTFAEYARLAGDAKESPIVEKEGFISFGTAIAYTF